PGAPPGPRARPGVRAVRRHDAAHRLVLHVLELREQHRLRVTLVASSPTSRWLSVAIDRYRAPPPPAEEAHGSPGGVHSGRGVPSHAKAFFQLDTLPARSRTRTNALEPLVLS